MDDLLKKLCALPAISGFEYLGNAGMEEIFISCLSEVKTDRQGNVTGYRRCGKKNASLVLLDAHRDTIGLLVKDIDEKGFLRFVSIGGIDPRTLVGAQVSIWGKQKICGVIGSLPPHILNGDEMKRAFAIDELAIDTGFSKDALAEIVQVGDMISFECEPIRMQNCISGSGLDNRAGLLTILLCIEQLSDKALDVDICVLASAKEETGRIGAKTAAYSIAPDMAVVLDVTHGKTPDGMEGRSFQIGDGLAICKGPVLSRHYTNAMIDIAKKHDIPYQIEVEAGDTGTNASAIDLTGKGVPCVMVSIPLRYMHTGVETLHPTDVQNAASLLSKFLEEFSKKEMPYA